MRPPKLALAVTLLAALAAASCTRRGPRDVGKLRVDRAAADEAPADGGGVAPPPQERRIAEPRVVGIAPTVLANVSAPAVATSKTHVYFGDAEADTLMALPKKGGGDPVRLARRAPTLGALAIDADERGLAWIGTPGNVVLHLALGVPDAAPTTLREGGLFGGVDVDGGDVFVVEAVSGGGALVRIAGGSAARIATFDGVPRQLLVDRQDALVVTGPRVLKIARQGGRAQIVASGDAFGAAALDGDALVVTEKRGGSRALVRIAKDGGAKVDVVPAGVRDAPIAVRAGEVFWFDESSPQIRARTLSGGATRTVSQAAMLDQPVALVADDDGLYVATNGDTSALVLVPMPRGKTP